MRQIVTVISLLLMLSQALAAEETATTKQYKALLDQYEQIGGARTFAKRFLEFAQEHPDDSTAIEALLWVVGHVRGRPETTRALDMLSRHHIHRKELGAACEAIASSRSISTEKLLRKMSREHPDKYVRAQACYFLAELLELEANLVQQLQSQPELARRVLQYYGTEYGKHLSSLKSAALSKQREEVYERMLKSFPDVEIQGSKVRQIAERQLFRIRHLSIGKVAPEIEGEDIHGKEFKLSDYRGKVVMLTFWGHW